MFDCLYSEGHDITGFGLSSRKHLLKAAVDWQDPIRWLLHRRGNGLEYFQEACQKGWEGIIAKQSEWKYVHGRSAKWLKSRCVPQQEFVIGGFTDPEGERVGFGALLLGYYRDNKFVFAGRVGTGFDDGTLRDLRQRMEGLERETSPYEVGNPDGGVVHFVTPEVVREVGFTEWTADGKLRHPRFKGLRRDKDARDVHREDVSEVADR